MKGLELAEAYYNEYGKRMIEEEFPEYADRIAVGLVIGSGGLRPSEITFRNVALSVLADGIPRKPLAEIDSLDGLIIRHDDLMPASGLYLRHADGITFENVRLSKIGKGKRPLFAADDCTGLNLIGNNELE